MTKFLLGVLAVGAWAMSAGAAPLACEPVTWGANPLGWNCDSAAAKMRARPMGGLVSYVAAPRAAALALKAQITPVAAGTNGWATVGVAFVDNDRNYWHLALVQAPGKDGKPGGRYFELCEMREGSWLSQFTDRLPRTHHRVKGPWRYGVAYDFALNVDAKGIRGEIRDAGGEVVFTTGFAFDGKPAVTYGRPGLHANGGFEGTFAQMDGTWSNPQPEPSSAAAMPYASDSFDPAVTEPATGFFRVVQRGGTNGTWWVIDPLGRGTVLLGVDHVKYHGHWSQRTGRSEYLEHNKVQFPDKADWEAETLTRLKDWGFNLLGAGCDPKLQRRGLIHTVFLSMGDSLCKEGMPSDYWICPNEHRPCSAFPNVFHPDFAAWCDYVARKNCLPNRDDPWLFGYFIDNELAWWGRGARDAGLFEAVAKLPVGHPARVAQEKFLAGRKPTPELKLDFLRDAAERYFRTAREAIRRYDPNHLVLGARFAGLNGAHPAVWEVAGRHCDVVTFNCYPWADLDRNEVRLNRTESSDTVAAAFARQYGLVKRPMLITEWSFPALDSGLPCTGGAGQRFMTQQLRTQATELFAKTMLALPFLVGYDYFMWVDEPAAGISDAFPEDSNYGLVDKNGRAYPGITQMFARLQRNIGRWRSAPLPEVRAAPPTAAGLTAAAFLRRHPPKGTGVTFTRTDKDYEVRSPSGLVLRGTVGGPRLVASVQLNGMDLGPYTGMLCDSIGGNYHWQDVARLLDVAWREENGAGVLTLTGEGLAQGRRFQLTHALTVYPDRPQFLAELVEARNGSKQPIAVHQFYFRQYAPFARDKVTGRHKTVPNLWKAPLRDAWVRTSDGVYAGGMTLAPTAELFQYHILGNGRTVHPDAAFAPVEKLTLAPGAVYRPEGGTWMLAMYGTGGMEAFAAAANALSE